jgi:hypothetical protein
VPVRSGPGDETLLVLEPNAAEQLKRKHLGH